VSGGIGRIMGAVFIIVYIFYLQNSIEKYGELGVETIEKNDLKKNIFEVLMAIGTSLPELFVSVSAARKGYMTMALGNIIGSNVANIFWVLGDSAVIRPIIIAPELIFIQLMFMLLLSVLLIIFKRSGYVIDRREGAVFLGIYVVFVLLSIAFGNELNIT
jgi:hypothetical protein